MHAPHTVKFFDDEANLFGTAAAFLASGLAAGEPALVIAPAARRAGILRALAARAAGGAPMTGDLLMIDAAKTLARFMDGDVPDGDRFHRTVADLVAPWYGTGRAPRIHAYGEMVDLLWQQGRPAAAVRLEYLWDDLAAARGVRLLCGYRLSDIPGNLEHLQRVCCLHGAVLDPSDVPNPLGSAG
jgi:hypothetical protein